MTGIYGLLFSSGVGLILYFPLFAVFLCSFYSFSESNRREALLFAGLFTEFLVFYGMFNHPNYPLSWSGYSWGPRYLLAALPYVVLPMGCCLPTGEQRHIQKTVFATLLVLGALINLLGVLVHYSYGFSYLWNKSLPYYWPQGYVFDPRYSPIVIHLRVLLENFIPSTNLNTRRIGLPSSYDLYLYFNFGPVSLGLFLAVVLTLEHILMRSIGLTGICDRILSIFSKLKCRMTSEIGG
jgi:hypothetical protein